MLNEHQEDHSGYSRVVDNGVKGASKRYILQDCADDIKEFRLTINLWKVFKQGSDLIWFLNKPRAIILRKDFKETRITN